MTPNPVYSEPFCVKLSMSVMIYFRKIKFESKYCIKPILKGNFHYTKIRDVQIKVYSHRCGCNEKMCIRSSDQIQKRKSGGS